MNESKNTEDRIELSKDEYVKYLFEHERMELDLFWKRATYYWSIIATIFAGYFLILSKGPGNAEIELLIEALGIVFSVSWYMVNSGSKFWNDHWVNKVKKIDEHSTFQLFNTPDSEKRDWSEIRYVFKPFPYSVTAINLVVSFYISVLWVILFLKSYYENFLAQCTFFNFSSVVVIFTISIVLSLFFFCVRRNDNIKATSR
jgi:hypothetical protein